MKQITYLLLVMLALSSRGAHAMETTKLFPALHQGKEEIGKTVCTNGNFMFVSSQTNSEEYGSSGGYVHVFQLIDGHWTETDTLEQAPYVSEACNRLNLDLAETMASDGEWLVLGAPKHYYSCSNANKGMVYLYRLNGDTWEYHSHLEEDKQMNIGYGSAVAIDGERLVVGAPDMYFWDPEDVEYINFLEKAGVLFYYKYNTTTDQWELEQEVSNPNNSQNDYFGRTLSMAGDWLISAVYNEDDDDHYITYFYEMMQGQWILRQSFENERSREGAIYDPMVDQVEIDGNYAFVSVKSDWKPKVQVYKNNGISWEAHQILYETESSLDYGSDFSIHGDFAVVNKTSYNGLGQNGAVYLYKNNEEHWTKVATIEQDGGALDDFFACDIHLGDSAIVVGAMQHDTLGLSNIGVAYAYSNYWDLPWVKADFSFAPMIVAAGVDVNFTNLSTSDDTNISLWKWDFDANDTIDSYSTNPTHQFSEGGHIPVTLTVSDGIFSHSITHWVTVIADDMALCTDYIPFGGSQEDTLGIAGWQADGQGHEAANIGHHLPQPPASINNAYYYLASRDYNDIDAQAQAGLVGNGDIINWPLLSQALSDNDKRVEDLEISFGLMSLGNDIRATDWQLDDDEEWRKYTGGTFSIKLNGEALVGGTMPELELHINYETHEGRIDIINGESSYALPQNESAASSATAQAIATAFMNDCNGEKIKLMFASIQSALQMEFFGDGRQGGYFNVPQAYILKGCPCALKVTLGKDVMATVGEEVQLEAEVSNAIGNVSYSWLPAEGLNDATVSNPVFTVDATTQFEVTVTDAQGCVASDVVKVTVYEAPDITSELCYDLLLPMAENQSNETIFPAAVAVNGAFAFVSDQYNVDTEQYAEVNVFTMKNGTWVQTDHLTVTDLLNKVPHHPNSLYANYGCSLDSDGDWLVVGAQSWYINDNGYQGAAFIYKRQGHTWAYHSVIYDALGSNTDGFGKVVSIDGDYIVASVPNEDNGGTANVGAVLVFKYNDQTDTWETEQRIMNPNNGANDVFGSALQVDGSRMIVGAPKQRVNGQARAGKVYIYKENAGTWTLEQAFEEEVSNTYLGTSVALSGNYALATLAHQEDDEFQVQAYHLDAGVWTVDSNWPIFDIGSGVDNIHVAIANDVAIVADVGRNTNKYFYAHTQSDTWGVAYLHQLDAGQWSCTDTILANNYQHVDDFGVAIDLEGGKAMIGVFADGSQSGKQGGAYIVSCFSDEAMLEADFSFDPMMGVALSDVQFTDKSIAQFSAITTWSWDFNDDGTEDSNLPNPIHQFTTGGHHKVSLTISDGDIVTRKTKWVTLFSASDEACKAYIPLAGSEIDGQGVAAWNARTGAPELKATGHPLPQPPASIDTAYYYMASRDYVNADATGAMSGNAAPVNWPHLSQALADQGYEVSDLTISFGLMTLGKDSKGVEWDLVNAYEWRKYNGGSFYIQLNGEDMIAGPMPELRLDIHYKAFEGGVDELSGETEYALPQNNSAASSAPVQAVADAFMQDCGDDAIKFLFASIESALQMDFDDHKRLGGYFDVSQGYLLKACACEMTTTAPDQWTSANEAIALEVNVSHEVAPLSYEWSPHIYLEEGHTSNPTAILPHTMTYQVLVTDAMGCTSLEFVTVHVDEFGTIEGYVRNSQTGDAIGEAELTLVGKSNKTTLTDKEGFYHFTELIPDANYQLKISKAGYYTDSVQDKVVISNEATSVDINLQQSTPTELSQAQHSGIKVHYNGRQILVQSEKSELLDIAVYDQLGRLILSAHTSKQSTWQSKRRWKQGIYLVKVNNTQGCSTKTLIIN